MYKLSYLMIDSPYVYFDEFSSLDEAIDFIKEKIKQIDIIELKKVYD